MTLHADLILKGQYTMGPLKMFLFDFHENWLINDKGPLNRFVCLEQGCGSGPNRADLGI